MLCANNMIIIIIIIQCIGNVEIEWHVCVVSVIKKNSIKIEPHVPVDLPNEINHQICRQHTYHELKKT